MMAYDKHYGYVAPNPVAPTLPWIFNPISTHDEIVHHWTHGLGFGDIDGDGRNDFITGDGWMRQPASLQFGKSWEFHQFPFFDRTGDSPYAKLNGGGDMYAYDVNGDGLNDVITSLDAHGWAWFGSNRSEMVTRSPFRNTSS